MFVFQNNANPTVRMNTTACHHTRLTSRHELGPSSSEQPRLARQRTPADQLGSRRPTPQQECTSHWCGRFQWLRYSYPPLLSGLLFSSDTHPSSCYYQVYCFRQTLIPEVVMPIVSVPDSRHGATPPQRETEGGHHSDFVFQEVRPVSPSYSTRTEIDKLSTCYRFDRQARFGQAGPTPPQAEVTRPAERLVSYSNRRRS